ncbi:mucin-2 [Halyomorpha halys]|uniref:mucin-2 n=1 Tax=Halyomorpha halys TaxID=286706 RepID=UPI0006D51520|nr:mucin-5AC-like [Halyomorpha halys]XP_024215176.1 mucin-5AC-like [Halyomorpha halys]
MLEQLTALLAAIIWLQAVAAPTGDHTCTGVVKHPVNVLVNVTEPVTFRSYTWCLRVPPRCSKYTVQLKDRVKLHVEMHNKTITVCCEGYVEMEGRCVPACPTGADCPFMRCNRTNHCHCTPGYTGLYCNEACPRGLWGKDCKRPCDCPSGYTCHHLTGDCFVDDRPPRRTTTPTTTTTTTTTSRPTTTITTPTTEGTTLETVKTPVFRFPPPPWVESAADNKKTTTRQVKKDEAPPTKEMDVTQETSALTTKKALLEIPLPTLAREEMPIKTRVERPTTIKLFPSLLNEEIANKKVIDESKTFKELETIEEFPIKPLLSTVSSKSTERDVLQSKVNLKMEGVTLPKEITTPIPTSPSTGFPNIIQVHTVTIETPPPIHFTTQHKNITQTSSPAMISHIPDSTYIDPIYTVNTKLPDDVTQSPTIVTETATTQQSLHSTKPVENTLKNEIQTNMTGTSINSPTTERTVQTTTQDTISRWEPYSSVNPRFAISSIEFPITTKQITNAYENANEREPIVEKQDLPSSPPTKLIHLEEKNFISTLSDLKATPENLVSGTENAAIRSTLNIKIPFTHKQGFSLAPLTFTTSNISIPSSSSIPNGGDAASNPNSTSSTPLTTYNHIISKNTAIPFPPFIHLTTPTTTMSNLLPITLITTTDNPTTTKSHTSPTTTIELPKTAVMNTSSPLTFLSTIIPSTIRKTAENFTPSTATPISTPITFASTSVTKPTTILESPTVTTVKIIASKFTVPQEVSEKEIDYDTIKPQLKETDPTVVPIPTLSTDIFKDLNTHKKLKPDEVHSSYSGQDKPKKKHEKIKSKNVNTKEFPSIYQTKTEKHDETIMQHTTEISLRSILQAATFKNRIITTKSPRPTKVQPLPDFMNINVVTEKRPTMEAASSAPTPSNPNHLWYALKKQNFSNTEYLEPLDILREPTDTSESILVSTEVNRVMESNTIDYRKSSEEPMKKVMTEEEETNYSLIFNKIKFNMTDSIAAGVKLSREESSYIHLPMILVLGIALMTLLLLTLTLWVYLKRRRQQAEPFPPCIMAYAMEEQPAMDCDSYDPAFFCPTFTNNYAERINRELRELNYDHPRRSQPEPLYSEIFN